MFLVWSVPAIAPEPGLTAPESAKVIPQAKPGLLVGTWRGGRCTYRIDYGGMLRIQRIDAPMDSIRYRYSWFRMGDHDCISMQRKDGDSLSLRVLLIGEVTDSRAVIALGAPFIRVESGKGLPGNWKHLDRFSRMEWMFGPEVVEYRRTQINPRTGEERLVERRTGTYHAASNKYEDGSFQLSFQDGSRAVILPIIYRNLMYLFDLSPVKSLFSRVEEPVTHSGITTTVQPDEIPRQD